MQVNHREVQVSVHDEVNSARLDLCTHTGIVDTHEGSTNDLIELSFHNGKRVITTLRVKKSCKEALDFLEKYKTSQLTIVFSQAGATFVRIIAIFPNLPQKQVSQVEDSISNQDDEILSLFGNLLQQKKPVWSKYLLLKIKQLNKGDD